jgi:hypothetical protein
MAETKSKEKELVATVVGGDVSVSSGAEMPEDELGHKGAEINAGATPFDPNAARRLAEGRGPGMQDSERFQPAHWAQPIDPVEALEQQVKEAERALARAKDQLSDAKKA